jgi:hypothetical protein
MLRFVGLSGNTAKEETEYSRVKSLLLRIATGYQQIR